MQTKRFVRIMTVWIVVWGIVSSMDDQDEKERLAYANHVSEEETNSPLQVEVMLRCLYLDGEVSEENVRETIYSMENFWAKYEEWQFIGVKNEKLVFRKEMDDISPLLKANGYFGVTDEGILTIFNGKPYKSNIIQSFFQIDVGKLESHKRLELKEGIPIKNKDQYVEVLETFKTYSKQEMQAN
jgi:forespore regulator of the sigma-K checkpoint